MKSSDSTRLGRIILALALALALAGCSAVKLGYVNLANLAYWWLDGYVEFSDEQAPLVRDELARLHGWHRQQELPQWVELLARMERMAAGEITPQQVCSALDAVQARLEAVAQEAQGPIVGVGATLTGRELRHIDRKFRRNNERFHEEWVALPPAELHEKRFDKVLERLERVYGRLDAPQRAVIRQRVQQSAYDPGRSLAEWQRRQQDLLQILRRIAHDAVAVGDARVLLQGWLERITRAPDPGYRAYQDGLRQEGCITMALVHQATTAAQRKHAVNRLRGWQGDLRELLAQP